MVKTKYVYRISRSLSHEGCFEVAKLTFDLEVAEFYFITPALDGSPGKLSCSCPSYKQPCKHQGWLREFLKDEEGNFGKFWHPGESKFISMENLG